MKTMHIKITLLLLTFILSGCDKLLDIKDAVTGIMPENAKQLLERSGNNVRFELINSQQNAVYSLNVDLTAGIAGTGVQCDLGEKVFDISAVVAQIRPEELNYWQGVTYTMNIDHNYLPCGTGITCSAVEVLGVGYYSAIPGFGLEVYAECTPMQ